MFQAIYGRAAWFGLVTLGMAVSAQAGPSVICLWDPAYAAVLGLKSEGLPFENEFVDEFVATVDIPAALEKYGLTGVSTGDRLELQSHRNGYWTLRHLRTYHTVKVALGWLVRYGIEPDKPLLDGEPPNHIEGRVVTPRILAARGFKSAANASRFVFEFDGGAWNLTLDPGGETRPVPL